MKSERSQKPTCIACRKAHKPANCPLRQRERAARKRWVAKILAFQARGAASFRLTSPVFDQTTIVETAPNEIVVADTAQVLALRAGKATCPKCSRRARIKSSSGVCGRCLDEWVRRTA